MTQSLKKRLPFILLIITFSAMVLSAQVIQTQESDTWENVEVDITSLKIKNNIITVRFKLRNTGSEGQQVQIHYNSCYIVDEKNQKKYYPLKDADGIYIAGPMYNKSYGGQFWVTIDAGKSKSFWIKFPEPTDNPEIITISIPGVFPFEELELKK